jgi:hypothetical protein
MKGEEEVVEGVEERGGGEAAADLDYDREEANDWKRGEAGGENREYADEYYNESPRANPREAAAYEKAQHAARDKVNSRASRSAMSQSGEWKL